MHHKGCNTNYYPNYYVRARSQVRTYYSGIPDAIQVAEHKYIDRQVLELFNSLTLFAWTSATNAAHVYHHSLSQLSEPRQSLAQYQLRTEHVWDGFVILSLLKDSMSRKFVSEPRSSASPNESCQIGNGRLWGMGMGNGNLGCTDFLCSPGPSPHFQRRSCPVLGPQSSKNFLEDRDRTGPCNTNFNSAKSVPISMLRTRSGSRPGRPRRNLKAT